MTLNQLKPTNFTRIYQPSVAKRTLLVASGGIVLLFGGALSFFSCVLWVRHQDTNSAVIVATLSLLMLVFSAKLIMEGARAKLVLLPDAIENHSAFFTRILRRDEIEGYTRILAGNTPAIEFWPKQNLPNSEFDKIRMIRIFLTFAPKAEIEGWISGLKNLDEEESKSGMYIYSSPLSPEALAEPNGPKWFAQGWIVSPTVAALLVYSMIAANAPGALEWIDEFITPMVNGLRFIGLGIAKPFMDGPMPERFYSNLVGLGVWGVVAYNTMSFWWMVNGKGLHALDRKAVWQRMKVHFGPIGSWFAIPAALFFYLLFVIYCTIALLNSVNGWFVFHVKDFIVPPFIVMMFAFPGAFIAALCFPFGRYIVLALLNRK
ncbi:MAG: hypothetical protein WA056_12915 [Gallionella sp.]